MPISATARFRRLQRRQTCPLARQRGHGYLPRRLCLHATKCQRLRTQDGINFLGFRIFPTHRLLRQTTARQFIRRLRLQSKLYARSLLSLQCIDRSVQSWLGHATHAATYGLRRSVFNAIAFRRSLR